MCDELGILYLEENMERTKDNNKVQKKKKANLVASYVCMSFLHPNL